MDLILFPTYRVPSALALPENPAPGVTAARFACWPDHVRREFAALAAEAGLSDRAVRDRTGIAPEALARARETAGLFALVYSEARVVEGDDVFDRAREACRRYRERKDAAAEPGRRHRRGGWKKRRDGDA